MFITSRVSEYDFWNTEGISDGKNYYLYKNVVENGKYHSCHGDIDDSRAGRSTSSVVSKVYDTLKGPQILLDLSWKDVPSVYEDVKSVIDMLEDYLFDDMVVKGASYPDENKSECSDNDAAKWKWESYTNLADSISLLPADYDAQPQFYAHKLAYRFMDRIGKNARFIKIEKPKEWKDADYPDINKVLYLESLGKTDGTKDAYSPEVVRIVFWKSLPDSVNNKKAELLPKGPQFDFNSSGILKHDSDFKYYIVKTDRPGFAKIDEKFFDYIRQDYFYVTIDTPVVFSPWMFTVRQIPYYKWADETTQDKEDDEKKPSKAIIGGSYALGKTTYPYIFGIREKEVDSIKVFVKDLSLRSTVVFKSNCTTCGDKPINCAPRPYKKGNFAYWESSEKYPANYELYDSSRARFDFSDTSGVKGVIKEKLKEYYKEEIDRDTGFSYFVGKKYGTSETSTVFCQQPIRHYKFPDNRAQYFMNEDTRGFDVESDIYPMGILINEDIVQAFLDFAVDSGFITKDQRDSVVGYEIYRGDRRLNRSVISTGIGYDMFKWFGDDGNIYLYPNYPYNDLSNDYYNYKTKRKDNTINHPFNKEGNVWYSYISPDNYFNKPELPTEVSIEGFQQGSSVGEFNMVEDHPKWVILGDKSYKMASMLANIEAIATVSAMIAEPV